MPRGGKREGAGRKVEDPSGITRKPRTFWVTPEEHRKLTETLRAIREQAKEAKSNESFD
jgi:hypothetical protein